MTLGKYIWFKNDERNFISREIDSYNDTKEEKTFEINFGRVIDSIRYAVYPMLSFRNGEPFSNFELMLGLMAFHVFMRGGHNIQLVPEEHKDEYSKWYYLYGNNTTARASAIYLIDTLSRYPSVVNEMKKLNNSFDIDKELYWAKSAMSPPGWSTSLTRSVILITRGLAYQSSGRINSSPPDKIIYEVDFMGAWANEYFELDNIIAITDDLKNFDFNNLTWTPT